MIRKSELIKSRNRIKSCIVKTPLVTNNSFKKLFGLEIFLKLENKQITNSFKIRGAANAILSYKEKYGYFPEKVVIQSSGNHAYATSYIAAKHNIKLLIFMASNVSQFKISKIKEFGAEVIICDKRSEANFLAQEKQAEGYVFIHPSDNDDVIMGQASCAIEIFEDNKDINYLFMPCGGGGLASGCYLAANSFTPSCKVVACEPSNANDAFLSIKNNKIYSFIDSPQTIADGARTLAVSQRCFNYLKKIHDLVAIKEERIIYWQKKMEDILQINIEPTSALSIAAIELYKNNSKFKRNDKICAIITGGNVANNLVSECNS